MAVKQILSNCKILYGNDSVTIGLRREEIIRDYFHGEIPEVTVLDSPGNYDLYRSYLEGQSLFAAKTVVVMENPFFIKRPPKDKKEENEFNGFINVLKELTPDILAIFTVDGALDKRTKASKTLLSVCGSEECSLLAPPGGRVRHGADAYGLREAGGAGSTGVYGRSYRFLGDDFPPFSSNRM